MNFVVANVIKGFCYFYLRSVFAKVYIFFKSLVLFLLKKYLRTFVVDNAGTVFFHYTSIQFDQINVS